MKTNVFLDINLASEIYARLLSKGLNKIEQVWRKIKRATPAILKS